MMKTKIIFALFLVTSIVVACSSLKKVELQEEDLTIHLRWHKSYDQENHEKVEKGLKWVLAHLGALLPKKNINTTVEWESKEVLNLNLSKAGFTPEAIKVWGQLIENIKSTDEYQITNSIDIGRFVVLTLNSSWHYYAITGVANTFEEFKQKYDFEDVEYKYLLPGESGVTGGMRVILSANSDNVLDIAHVAIEGEGKTKATFIPKEFEVIDVMENGQGRFAIYGEDGFLRSGAGPNTEAGKPAKCLWCHETVVQPLRTLENMESKKYSTFKNLINKQKVDILKYQTDLSSISDDFREIQREHYLAEILYLAYLNSPMQRIENEFAFLQQNISEIKFDIKDSIHYEFNYLKNLVDRKQISTYLPYEATWDINVRETMENENNFLK